ncbi:MAG: hypothetical protein V4631_06310 [Pseudomonadota bacterium]
MLTPVHFDQFTQTMHLNLSTAYHLHDAAELFMLMAEPGPDAFTDSIEYVLAQKEKTVRLQAALLLSMGWHEKRHFSDLMLTNYGAYRRRLNFQIMNAGPALVREAQSYKHLVVPILAYADEVRLEAMGVEPPYAPDTCAFAENITKRYLFHEMDRVRLPSGMQLSATSCLEALAYVSQLAAIEYYFGKDLCRDVQLHLHACGLPSAYSWLAQFGRDLGLLSEVTPGDPEGGVKLYLAAPLLFMALCGQSINSREESPANDGLMPTERLATLIAAMIERKLTFHGLDSAQAWQLLDEVHYAVWGRRCADNLSADLQRDEEMLAMLAADGGAAHPAAIAFAEYVALRRRMIADFRVDPGRFVDPYVFPDALLPKLCPRPVLHDPTGQFFPVPDGWKAVCAGGLSDHASCNVHSDMAHWWWSITPQSWSVPSDGYGFESAAWIDIMDFLAPLAQFLISGRAAQDCTGPELQLIEQALRNITTVHLEPQVAQARLPDAAAFWSQFTGNVAKCDLSGEPVDRSDALLISPWRIHLSKRNMQFVLDQYGQDNLLALPLLLKDWSVWVVHQRYAAMLEA